VHRILHSLCLVAAILALLLSAQIAHRLAQAAMKEIGQIDHTLPELTRTMVVHVADGSLPIRLLAGATGAVVAITGLFAIFSPKLSPQTAGSTLLIACTIAFAAALLLLATTAIAISIGRAPLP
jgi:hypothetical protein